MPPLVTGLVVTMIGLALVKVGIQYAAGGVPAINAPEYGSLLNWSAALVVILVTLGLKFYARGMLAVSAVTVRILAGYRYALSIGLGLQMDPKAVQYLPDTLRILMTSGLLPAALIAIILNLVLPEQLSDEAVEEVSGGLSGHGEGSLKG